MSKTKINCVLLEYSTSRFSQNKAMVSYKSGKKSVFFFNDFFMDLPVTVSDFIVENSMKNRFPARFTFYRTTGNILCHVLITDEGVRITQE